MVEGELTELPEVPNTEVEERVEIQGGYPGDTLPGDTNATWRSKSYNNKRRDSWQNTGGDAKWRQEAEVMVEEILEALPSQGEVPDLMMKT